jgi:GH25 family lysozyme M1 (1,4-beta-N-acetylmuramidase)
MVFRTNVTSSITSLTPGRKDRSMSASQQRRSAMFEPLENRLLCRAQGVDVASYQGSPNWSSVYNAGIRFVYAKATEGTTYTNPYLSSQVSATGSSIVVGVYHFARFGSATGEADHFYNAAKAQMKNGFLRPALDVEVAPPSGSTKTSVSNWVNDFGNRLFSDSSGASQVIYSSVSYASTWFNSSVTQWNNWMASWNGQSSQTGNPSGTSPWSGWNFWQYTDSGSVSGISGSVDRDVANGTMTGYVIPNLVQSHDSKFNTGQTVHVTATSGLKAWNTYTSDGTYVVEPNGKAGVIQMSHPVYIQGYRRWEVKYSGDSTNRWSAEDWLA